MNQHELFNKQLEKASVLQRERFKLFMDQYKDIKFTDTQRRYLLWLASWDKETIKTFKEIFELFEGRGKERVND